MSDHSDRYTRFKFDLARNPMRPRCSMRACHRPPWACNTRRQLAMEAAVPTRGPRLRRRPLRADAQRGTRRRPRRSAHVALQPVVDQPGDVEVVLLDHDHVAVALDALVLQPDALG